MRFFYMKKIEQFIDATFLKTEQNGLTSDEVNQNVQQLLDDAVRLNMKLVMIRPEFIQQAKAYIKSQKSSVGVGTVIDFPFGDGGIETKIKEAEYAINQQADELDFVIDYKAFQKGECEKVKQEVYTLTALCLENQKVVKWIIETAALTDAEIIRITTLIKNVIVSKFNEKAYEQVYVKSSTGFYKTPNDQPNGANVHVITLMLENATPLNVKASGGIKTREDAIQMIQMGVKRIGTSSHLAIVE